MQEMVLSVAFHIVKFSSFQVDMLYRGIEDQSVGISVALAGFAIADVNTIYLTS